MARWRRGLSVWLASAILLVGCFGGQTGEPASVASCEPQTVSRDQSVDGVSPAELARAFEGRHTAPLGWHPWNGRDGAPPPDNDEIAVTVTYEGADASLCDELQVEVALDVTTKFNGVHETGKVNLFATPGVLDSVSLRFSGNRVDVDATLNRVDGVVTLSGTLDSIDTGLPGMSAVFPPPPAGAP